MASSTALQERLSQSQSQAAAPPAAKVELQAAVRQATAAESSRIMLESRPSEPASQRRSLPTGASTAAYLIEMRLQQELADVQEDMTEEAKGV
jgi:hypothetical protein